MTPERWHQITAIFHATRERDPSHREAFLAEACGGDDALRQEVEAMLAGDTDASWPGKTSPLQSLDPGTQFGPYRIERLLGRGGMGEVYRARDTTLGRDVAIKVLPTAWLAEPGRLERFQREARVLAALNHPNIAAIYGIEQVDGLYGLVLELVEGPTLADQIARGPMTMDTALPIARQIAEALEAAHERGVVHRDVKPANIVITRTGVAKVLDFGLATTAASDPLSAVTQSPTMAPLTREGLIVGTVAYMSPEQARGQAVDRRTDVWAFGCVLFEMLTGRQVFGADTPSDTLVAILERDPPWEHLSSATPPSLQRLLRRCLAKDPTQRARDMGDVCLDLDEVRAGAATVQPHPGRQLFERWTPRRGLMIAVAVLAVSATAAITVWLTRPATVPGITRLTVRSSDAAAVALSGVDRDIAISPDGRRIAYVGGPPGQPQLFIRFLDQLEPKALPAGTGSPRGVFFSPDGEWIGFFDGTATLKKVAVTGGPPITIC